MPLLGLASGRVLGRVQGGEDTLLWRVERAGVEYALRVLEPHQAGRAAREAAAMRAAVEAGVPAPITHASAVAEGRPCLLLSWLPGRTVLEEAGAHPASAGALGRAAGAMLARLHTADLPSLLAARPDGWINDAGPGTEALQRRLRDVAGAPALLHLDLHPQNILAEGARITGVIDWANAQAGDPRADLARTLVLVRGGAQERDDPQLSALAVAFEEAFLAGYAEAAGTPADLDLFLAWAWAATLQDQAAKLGGPGFVPSARRMEILTTETKRALRNAGL